MDPKEWGPGTYPFLARNYGRVDAAGGNGFFLDEISERGLVAAVERAMLRYRSGELGPMIASAMDRDASWEPAIASYVSLYRAALARVR